MLRTDLSPLDALRLAALVLSLLTLLSAGHSFLTYDPVTRTSTAASADVVGQPVDSTASDEPVFVVTVDGAGREQLVALDAGGKVVYQNYSLSFYHDVDPSPSGTHTVTYVGSERVDGDACSGDRCLRNVIERVNLTTGETTRLHAWTDVNDGSTQTHDVDRVDESVFLVADISFPDRVYMVNTTTGETVWEWRVAEAFGRESGGAYPNDWTHVNDVEYLHDGRVMVNLRNQDQIVFLEPGDGIQPNWTLGDDDDHATLYEQHNPDYIPASRGGPAVVVADSENNRVVEYQRVNGSWRRTWHWQDTSLQWPRDADRLPSGHTLIADSHGERILSVAPSGRIAWSHTFPTGSYDVERLGTGDESDGGSSAAALGLRGRWPATRLTAGNTSNSADSVPGQPDTSEPGDGPRGTPAARADSTGGTSGPGSDLSLLGYWISSAVPPLVLHGTLYVLPAWATALDATLVLTTSVVGGCWLVSALGLRVASELRDRRS